MKRVLHLRDSVLNTLESKILCGLSDASHWNPVFRAGWVFDTSPHGGGHEYTPCPKCYEDPRAIFALLGEL